MHKCTVWQRGRSRFEIRREKLMSANREPQLSFGGSFVIFRKAVGSLLTVIIMRMRTTLTSWTEVSSELLCNSFVMTTDSWNLLHSSHLSSCHPLFVDRLLSSLVWELTQKLVVGNSLLLCRLKELETSPLRRFNIFEKILCQLNGFYDKFEHVRELSLSGLEWVIAAVQEWIVLDSQLRWFLN